MKHQIITTKDGSHSLQSAIFGEAYHSHHGAIQESMHVFIGHGLEYMAYRKNTIKVFEMGFGTGLNAWLSLKYAKANNVAINYHTIEQYPISIETASQLNYENKEHNEKLQLFNKLHQVEWNNTIAIDTHFYLTKQNIDLYQYQNTQKFDVIYYDAFAPNVQAELWTLDVFQKMYKMLNENGILVTYCAKGYVRRNMEQAGFTIERLDGPIGKREMLRGQVLK